MEMIARVAPPLPLLRRTRPPSLHLRPRGRRHPRTHRRGVVTSSVSPPPHAPVERPETVVLAESPLSLYRHPWTPAAASFFPPRGMGFASLDLLGGSGGDGGVPSLRSMERTMAADLSELGSPAHAVVIARGPLPCLAAQYFLESLPLAGLVLVDPLLLPDDGRAGAGGGGGRWMSSLSDLMTMLNGGRGHDGDGIGPPPPLLSQDGVAPDDPPAVSLERERSLLDLLAEGNSGEEEARPLRLEPGATPTLVAYTGDHVHGDRYRVCAERTAAFHTCGGTGEGFDQVPVVRIRGEVEGGDEDGPIDEFLGTVHEWYDEAVA